MENIDSNSVRIQVFPYKLHCYFQCFLKLGLIHYRYMPNVGSEVILPGVIKIEAYEPFNFLASCKLEIVLVIPIFHLLDASIYICK